METRQPVPSQQCTGLSPLPGHPQLLAAPESFHLSPAFYMFVSSSSFFHWRGAVPSQFLRRRLCFSWSREGARSSFPLLPRLPWKASSGQDPSSCPCHPFPALGHQLAVYVTGLSALLRALAVWQLSNKAPGSSTSPTRSIFSEFRLSNFLPVSLLLLQ